MTTLDVNVLEVPQRHDLVVDRRGDDRIESGRRIVEPQEPGLRRHRTGNRHAAANLLEDDGWRRSRREFRLPEIRHGRRLWPGHTPILRVRRLPAES